MSETGWRVHFLKKLYWRLLPCLYRISKVNQELHSKCFAWFESKVNQGIWKLWTLDWRLSTFLNTGYKSKHRKNCECCPVSQLIVRYQRLSWIQVFNFQNCNQCLKCHKSPGLSCQKLSKIVRKMPKLSKIVIKIVIKNCLDQIFRFSENFQIFKLW